MRHYKVYTENHVISISADQIKREFILDKMTKIWFINDNKVIAEFSADRICGWQEVVENPYSDDGGEE